MFGVPLFLAGLAAVGVPIAIHLLARQRTRVLPWGAMEFLRKSTSSASARRNRLKDLLLLLLRCLAILFLVLTFAQPLASRLLIGGDDLETIFVWDVSLSTTARDEAGRSPHEALRESLLEELGKLPDRSRVRVMLAGAEQRWLADEALTLSEANRRLLEAEIKARAADQGSSELGAAILSAIAVELPEAATQRQIVVFHDGQREAWQTDDPIRWRAIRRELASRRELSLRVVEPSVVIDPEGIQVAVTRVEPERDSVAPNTPVRIQATLHNYSASETSFARLTWRIDGREIQQSFGIEIPPGQELEVEEFLTFPSPGCHRVECELRQPEDVLPADNILEIVISVPLPLPLLIVDDTQRTQSGQILPSEFLLAALGVAPGGKDRKRKPDGNLPPGRKGVLFQPRIIGSEALASVDFNDYVAVVVAQADSLETDRHADLRRFVEKGGGVWLMMDASWETPPGWLTGLLGDMGLEALSETVRQVAKGRDKPMRVMASDPESRFARDIAVDRLDLHRAELRNVHALKRRVFLEEESLLQTSDGHPFLLSLGVGAGRILLQTTDFSRLNTNVPVLQTFVPLVRESVRESIRGALPPRNLEPGDVIRVPTVGRGRSDEVLRIRHPDGSTHDMVFQGDGQEFSETLQPGTYTLFREEAPDPEHGPETFVVRRPPSESDLQAVPDTELANLIESKKAMPPAAAEERRRGRWPLAWWFAILTGLLFLAEALLAHWITLRREAGAPAIDLKPIL